RTTNSRKRSAASLRPPAVISTDWSIIEIAPKRVPNSSGTNNTSGRPVRTSAAVLTSATRLKGCEPPILGLRPKFLFDAQKLIVFGGAMGSGRRAGFDLPEIGSDGEVGDGRVLGLARAMRNDRGVAGLVSHFDRRKRFGERADLIDLDQDGIRVTADYP